MTYIDAIILGFIEGATEFIPVSSTAHLIIVRDLLHIQTTNPLAFDAVLQFAATLAVVLYFWKDIWGVVRGVWHRENTEARVMAQAIIAGTIPAVILGLLLETYMETVFRHIDVVAGTLVLGSVLMWYAQRRIATDEPVSVQKGLIIGLFQSLALLPGISRSGATISGGLVSGLSRDTAVRFSFLLSIPILLGSGGKKLFELVHATSIPSSGELLVGALVAFVVGFCAVDFLIRFLRTHSFNSFIVYRLVLAVVLYVFL